MRVDAAMRRLAEPVEPATRRVVPPELKGVLAEGWRARAGISCYVRARRPCAGGGWCLRTSSASTNMSATISRCRGVILLWLRRCSRLGWPAPGAIR